MLKTIACIFIFFPILVFTQVATGNWRMHIANKAIGIARGGSQVFVALETGLLEYDVDAQESTLWTDVNVLSDIQVSSIFYHDESASFFVGYKNGNIDRIQNNTVTNIPAIKLAAIQGDKTVNSFTASGYIVYASTGLGIVLINTVNNEIKDTYYPNSSDEGILSVTFMNDSLFALTKSRVWKSNLSNVTLADPAQWQVESKIPVAASNENYISLFAKNSELYLTRKMDGYGSDTLFRVDNNQLTPAISFAFDTEINSIQLVDNKILMTVYDGVIIINEAFVHEQTYNNFSPYSNTLPMSATLLNGNIFIADNNYGLFEFEGATLKKIESSGPAKNSFSALSGTKTKLAVAGGLIQKNGSIYNTSGAYLFEDEVWTSFNHDNQSIWSGKNVFDISCVSINPTNEKQIAIGSYSEIPLSISEDGTNLTEVFDAQNSLFIPHASPIHENICVSDLEYDSKGNLWVLNGYSLNPLKVYTKDKLWYEFNSGSTAQGTFSGKMVIDYSGNKWFTILDKGLFGYNDNLTISDPSDDEKINLTNTATTGDLPDMNITALAVDYDNEIWIGTSAGFAVLYNPDNTFGAAAGEYNAQRIKIDYEGNVEYVLGNTAISDIEVDGGNRKWIGTANAGIFLLSSDGTEVLESYTKENSDLISNNIIDMQFLGKTGELFIITDIGMVSLRTDASTGDDEYEDVIVFPNPVKPDFEGLITIQGIKYDSDVKFTDAGGNLVFKTTSNGGTATWNGKHFNGEKVKAGTYIIWTSSNTEKGRKVGKVVILN